jgi:putative transposase
MVTPAARREAVANLRTSLEVSERRACSIIAADRSAVRYLSRRPDDTVLRARLRELADQRRRFGYRRLHVLLRSEGWTVNRKKTQRLYGEEGLAVRRRRSRRRIAVARTPIPKPNGPNSRWSTDFVHDQLANGRRFRVLTIIDDVNQGVSRRRPGHLAERQAGGARDRRADRPARPPRRDRQRQWH